MAKHNTHTTALMIVAIVAIVGIVGLMGGGKGFAGITGAATNFTNITETLNLNCTTWIAINDYTIDASGYVLQDCYNATVFTDNSSEQYCWGPDNSSFLDFVSIENKGNNYINVTIKITNDAGNFFGTPGNDLQVKADHGNGSVAYGTDDNETSCALNLRTSWTSLKPVNTVKSLCGALNWPANKDELVFFDRFSINITTPPGTYTFTKTVQATEYDCPVGGGGPGAVFTHFVTTNNPGSVNAYELDQSGNIMDSYDIGNVLASPGTVFTDATSVGAIMYGFDAADWPAAKFYAVDTAPLGAVPALTVNMGGWNAGVDGTPQCIAYEATGNPGVLFFITSTGRLVEVSSSTGAIIGSALITGLPSTTYEGCAPYSANALLAWDSATNVLANLNTGTKSAVLVTTLSAAGGYGGAYKANVGNYQPNSYFGNDNVLGGNFVDWDMTVGNVFTTVRTFTGKTPRGATAKNP